MELAVLAAHEHRIDANELPKLCHSLAVSLPQHGPDTLEHLEFDDHSEIPYVYVEVLGKGQKATVEKVKHARTGSVYARKIYKVSPRSRNKRKAEELEFKNEIAITRRLARHRHIVRVVASYSTSDTLAVVLEPAADSGDLKTFLALYPTVVDQRQKSSMLTTIHHAYGCLASGLAFMHAHRIRHRDIKPENILIHAGSVLFTDFGVSRDYSGRADSATDGVPGAFTARYCAPEVQDQGRRTWRSDVFSLGVVFLLLYTAVNENAIVELAKSGRFYVYLEAIRDEIEGWTVDGEVVNCLSGMLREEEGNRLHAGEVLDVLKRGGGKYFCVGCQGEEATLEQCADLEASTSSISSDSSDIIINSDASITPPSISTEFRAGSPPSHESYHQKSDMLSLQDYLHNPTTSAISQESESQSHTLATRFSRPRNDSMISDIHPECLDTTLDTPYTRRASTDSCETAYSLSTPFSPPYIPPPTSPPTSQITYLQTTCVIPNIYAHKMVRTTKHTELPGEECILYQDQIYDFTIKRLGFGVRLSRCTPYGSILPSLRIFPVIPDFDSEWQLIQDGTLLEVQQAFATGKLHPFVQDDSGYNLLHLSIRCNRPDITTYLHRLGVKPIPTHSGHTPFMQVLNPRTFKPIPPQDVISTLRLLLTTLDHQPDFTNPLWHTASKHFLWDEDVTYWLSTSGVEYGLDRTAIEELCLRVALRGVQTYVPAQMDKAEKLLRQYLTPTTLRQIKQSSILLVPDLFYTPLHHNPDHPPPPPSATFALGALWLKVLASYATDIPSYLIHEIDAYPDYLLRSPLHDRKIIAGLTKDGEFVLGWRVATEHTPGYPLVKEFKDLGGGIEIGEWPYAEWGDGEWDAVKGAEMKRRARFLRRLEGKERKGQRLSELSNTVAIPGSWVE